MIFIVRAACPVNAMGFTVFLWTLLQANFICVLYIFETEIV